MAGRARVSQICREEQKHYLASKHSAGIVWLIGGQAPKTSPNSQLIGLDMLGQIRDMTGQWHEVLHVPLEHAADAYNALHGDPEQKLLNEWHGLVVSVVKKLIKRFLKLDRKFAKKDDHPPPENGTLQPVGPLAMSFLRELSFGYSEMILWLLDKHNAVLKQEYGNDAESVSWGDILTKLVMGVLINFERAARSGYSSLAMKAFFLMNNYKYIWDSLVQYRINLKDNCLELHQQSAQAIEEAIRLVRPKAVEYAKVFKWEAFGSMLDAVWQNPDLVTLKTGKSRCFGPALSEEEQAQLGFEMEIADRFLQFNLAFEELIDPDNILQSLVIPDIALRHAFNECVRIEVIGGYTIFHGFYRDQDFLLAKSLELTKEPIVWAPKNVNDALRGLFREKIGDDQFLRASELDPAHTEGTASYISSKFQQSMADAVAGLGRMVGVRPDGRDGLGRRSMGLKRTETGQVSCAPG